MVETGLFPHKHGAFAPIDRNEEAMAYWRPRQEAHYLPGRPLFV